MPVCVLCFHDGSNSGQTRLPLVDVGTRVNVSTSGCNGLMPMDATATAVQAHSPPTTAIERRVRVAWLRNTRDSRLAVWGISPGPELLTSVGIVRSSRLRILMKLGATESRHRGFKRAPLPTYLLPSGPQRFSITSCLHFLPCCSRSQCGLPCFTNPTPHPPLDRGGLSVPWWPISHSSANCCYTMSINLSGVHTLPPPVPRVVWLCGQQHLIMAESQFQHKFGCCWPGLEKKGVCCPRGTGGGGRVVPAREGGRSRGDSQTFLDITALHPKPTAP